MFVQHVGQITLYVATSDHNGGLYFSKGPFPLDPNRDIAWKGPHSFPQKQKLTRYTLAAYGSKLAIVGGWKQETGYSNQVWIMLTASSQAEQLPPMKTKRLSAAAVSSENYLVVAGGSNEGGLLTDVEVYNGTQWLAIKPLPKTLRNLSSILHNGIWYLVEEVNQNEAGTTYSISLEKLIRVSEDAEWQMLDQCSSGEMRAGPVSFDGQLLVIKWLWYSEFGVHMLSPKTTKSWLQIAHLESAEKISYAKVFQHASMISLPEGQLMVITVDSDILIGTIKGI